jgi:hypothetical protein
MIAIFFIGVLLLFALSFFAIFLPYGFHDDYRYLGNSIDRSSFWKLHPDMRGGISMGRPIAMVAIGLQSLVTTSLESLVWQRAIFFWVIIGFSFALYRFLNCHLKWHCLWSMATALLFCCLPQCALLLQYSVLSVFASLSLLTTFIAHRFYRKSMSRHKCKNTPRWRKVFYICLAILSLQLSFYNYPVMGVFFCIFTYATLLFSGEEPRKLVYVKCLQEIIFLSVSMILFFVSFKVVYQPTLFSVFPDLQVVYEQLSYHKLELSLSWRSFLMPLVYGAIPTTSGPFHPVLGDGAALISAIFAAVLIFLFFMGRAGKSVTNKNYNKNGLLLLDRRRLIEALIGFCIFYPLSLSPVMLSSWQHTLYRTALGSCCLYLLLFMFLLKGVLDRFIIPLRREHFYAYLLILLFLTSAAFYHLTVTNYAVSATREQQYISQVVADEVEGNPHDRPLTFMINGYNFSQKKYPVFGLFKPSWEFAMTMFCPLQVNIYEFVEYIAKLRGQRCGVQALKIGRDINNSGQGEIVPSNVKARIIDLKYISALDNKAQKNIYTNSKDHAIAAVSTEGVNIQLTGENENLTVRFPQNDFWETTDDFPHSLEIDFGEGVQLTSYSLQRSQYPEGPERMPRSWKVYASTDRVEFALIDNRAEVNDWNSIDFVRFGLNETVSCRKLRFMFDQSTATSIFRLRALKLHFLNRNIIKSITFSDDPVFTRAMREGNTVNIDFPVNLFWETSAPPPRTMDIELNSNILVAGYDLQRSEFKEGPERISKLWEVYGSMDGETYLLLDERHREAWNRANFIPFEFDNVAEVRFLRFVFGLSKTDIFRLRALRLRLK